MYECIKKLGEIASAKGGSGFPKKYQGKKEGQYPFFKVSDMNLAGNEIYMNHAANYVDDADLAAMKAKFHPAGTIVFPKIGGAISTNKKRLLTCDAIFDNNVMGVVPNTGVSSEYIYKFFVSLDLYDLSNKAALPSITAGSVSELEIPLPPIPEQQRIVAILDQAFADIEKARANAEKNLKNARELSMASIRETFLSANNTELLTIDELADVITDYVANGSFAALAENVQYKSEKDYAILLRLVDHSKSYKNDFVYINQHAFTFLKKSVVVPNDIILSNVGARLGTVFRAPDLGMPMSLGPNSILIKSTEYGDYLYCWLQSAYGQSEIKSIVSGAGQPKFNKTQFKKLFVPVPKSVSERAEIVERIESITQMLEHLESIYSRKLTALEELKKSLLQKAFSGELTKTEGHAA